MPEPQLGTNFDRQLQILRLAISPRIKIRICKIIVKFRESAFDWKHVHPKTLIEMWIICLVSANSEKGRGSEWAVRVGQRLPSRSELPRYLTPRRYHTYRYLKV